MTDVNGIIYRLYRDRAHVLPGADLSPRFVLELSNLTEKQVRDVLSLLGDGTKVERVENVS